ncbi:MAG: efflux RND transporter periplasmic adaptor subunit [Candidatus Paceibacterota bacterium]|jgi:multidrug efflux pump subunit AcrA (membrane-fusion protein)
MKNFISKAKKYSLFIIVIIIVAVIAYYFIWYKNGNGQPEIITVAPTDFLQTVSVSGKVIPAKSVELGFNKSGKISQVPVIVGQSVSAGQLLAELDSRNEVLALDNAKIDLKKMLESSNLSNQNSLSKDDETSLAGVDKAYIEMSDIFDGLNSILNNYQVSTYKNNLINDSAKSYYNSAQTSYYQARRSYDLLLADYRKLERPLTKTQIAKLAEDTYGLVQSLSRAVNDTNTFVSFVYNDFDESSRSSDLSIDKNNLSTWRLTLNELIPTLSSNRNDLKDSTLSIEAQRLVVTQKENDYADCFLRAPFAGVITRLDIKSGEQAIAGQATISMINSGLFQIESFVPEIYIAGLIVGNEATVTLDAYGTETAFKAKVISIDPAETIKDGVSTYKVKLQFESGDSRIKPGMTSNLVITTYKKPNVISVPSSAITSRSGQNFVQVKVGEAVIETPVTLGQVGTLGQTEITSGLKTGDQVVLTAPIK